jgi:P27 family predicted phage terminase small subunit
MTQPRLGGSRQQKLERQRRAAALEARREAQGIESLADPLPAPAHLGEAGRRVWELVMTERFRTITPAEVPALERYGELHDRRQELLAVVAVEGWTTAGSRPGMRMPHPCAVMLDQCDTQLRQLEGQFGLTPKFRARLQIDVLIADRELSEAQGRRELTAAQVRELAERAREKQR